MTVEDKALLNHTAAYCRLVETMKRAKEHNRPFCMFLGAGCSLTSSKHSITTEQVIKDCLKQYMGSEYVVPNSWESLYKDFVNNVWNAYAADDSQEILYERFKDVHRYDYDEADLANGWNLR